MIYEGAVESVMCDNESETRIVYKYRYIVYYAARYVLF